MIYLASASPRRRELLAQAGLAFEVVPSNIVELAREGEPPAEYVQRVALDKARFVAKVVRERGLPARPVLGADTEVVLDGAVLGKPRDRADGIAMLRRLSGRAHSVLTGIALVHQDGEYGALSESRVTFARLTDDEIARYWETGEPADKAGGYAIQGRGAVFISRIEGSYSGVVGLPLHELAELLKRAGAAALP
ncbi:septum formation protein Maf [Sulfurifustis variabilis]|uniref:dTTP/UTP pyrophosphatase n=1 Tax=Sulfurifustis variabilis TaxID=1675686 RepID=A0A1B4V1Q4_9GAMM|nr:septum formation protein Maf [Sulfurifustis variabilis]